MGTPLRLRTARSARVSGFSIDSRTLRPGEFFVALRGRHVDGHDFLQAAFARGASGALISSECTVRPPRLHNLIAVPDTLRALQALARARRLRLTIPVVAVTGSAGKSTTKELLWQVFALCRRAYRSAGTHNTEIGLPLALLNMPARTELAILELGMQRRGEIHELAEIARPTVGVITSVGDAHLGFFRDRSQIARAKWELIESLPRAGLAVWNADAPIPASWHAPCRAVRFGLDTEGSEYTAGELDVSDMRGLAFTLRTPHGRWALRSALLGRANVYNILAAAATSLELGVAPHDVQRAVAQTPPLPHRLQLRRSRRFGWVLDDSYNASPSACREALHTLVHLRARGLRRVFVLGDMAELGDFSLQEHREFGRAVARADVDAVFMVGELAGEASRCLQPQQRAAICADLADLSRAMREQLPDAQNLILVKGSRIMGLDRLVEELCGKTTAQA